MHSLNHLQPRLVRRLKFKVVHSRQFRVFVDNYVNIL